jgi:mRNA interferase MazF
MRRGEVWWVEFDERRPVVLLSEEGPSGFRAMQVVAPAGADISGLGVEVAVGVLEGLPFEGVLRLAFPRPGFTPCTWLTTLSRDDLIERAGALSPAKLSEIDGLLAEFAFSLSGNRLAIQRIHGTLGVDDNLSKRCTASATMSLLASARAFSVEHGIKLG